MLVVLMLVGLVKPTVDAHDDAEDLGCAPIVLGNENGRHVLVGGLESNVLALRVVVLAGGFVADARRGWR
jgi:hypothetical protein